MHTNQRDLTLLQVFIFMSPSWKWHVACIWKPAQSFHNSPICCIIMNIFFSFSFTWLSLFKVIFLILQIMYIFHFYMLFFYFLFSQGCISVSMSIHQTNFCFICSHLASGEKEGDELRRNSDVIEILKNTQFPKIFKAPGCRIPEKILDHECASLPHYVSVSVKCHCLNCSDFWHAFYETISSAEWYGLEIWTIVLHWATQIPESFWRITSGTPYLRKIRSIIQISFDTHRHHHYLSLIPSTWSAAFNTTVQLSLPIYWYWDLDGCG